MQNRGYTIPELIIVIVIVGIFSMVLISKTSYAFTDTDEVAKDTERLILIKSATDYGNSILETVKEKDQYITGKDLMEAEYLIDENNRYQDIKLKLSYDVGSNSTKVEILD